MSNHIFPDKLYIRVTDPIEIWKIYYFQSTMQFFYDVTTCHNYREIDLNKFESLL